MSNEKDALITRLKQALSDTIRSPCGIIPKSAEEFFTYETLQPLQEDKKRTA